jgi:hypothetical protein
MNATLGTAPFKAQTLPPAGAHPGRPTANRPDDQGQVVHDSPRCSRPQASWVAWLPGVMEASLGVLPYCIEVTREK